MTDEQAVNKLTLESASFRLEKEGLKAFGMAMDALRNRVNTYSEAFSKGYDIGYGCGYGNGWQNGYSAAEQGMGLVKEEVDDGR